MGNSIKYSVGSESNSLNKGNWWIGTGDTNKGPTAESGYWNAINPPSGGYTVYLNKESNGPSIHSISNDEHLISFTNKISGNNYVNVAECLVYYQTQDDKLCVNREIENIVTDGLVLNLDAGYAPSYPTSGTTWYDLSGNNYDGTLVNGPLYDSGSIVFDATDDFIDTNFNTNFSTADFTLTSWVYPEFDSALYGRPIMTKNGNGGCGIYDFALEYGRQSNKFSFIMDGGTGNPNLYSTTFSKNNWYNAVATREYLGGTNYKCSIYINGSLNVTTTGNFTGGNGSKMTIGKFVDCNGVGEWLGKISISGIYNRALTPSEILQNYNAQKSRFGL